MKKTSRQQNAAAICLLFAEGHAVGALIHGRIHLVGTNQNLVQGAVVLMAAMVGTLLDGAFDALVCMTVHKIASFLIGFGNSMDDFLKTIREKLSNIAKPEPLCYSLF